jgi:transcriptional regulator with XRE-family HTH domain
VARGTAEFNGRNLRELRKSQQVNGRLLSAQALADLVGTSKARILAYETNKSVPEPKRIAQLAAVFAVTAAELCQTDTGHPTVRDLRCQAGLTAAQVADAIHVSRASYRNIERLAQLPVRDNSVVRMNLAVCLGISRADIDRALYQHPLAIARRAQITDHMAQLFKQARHLHKPAVVNPDDPRIVHIAQLLQRVPSVVCRLVNDELNRYRNLLKAQSYADTDNAYAQSERARKQARYQRQATVGQIETAPVRSADTLSSFLTEAMSAREWRLMVDLSYLEPNGIDVVVADGDDFFIWQGLRHRRFVEMNMVRRETDDGWPLFHAVLSSAGARCIIRLHTKYGCLYPRVRTPRLAHLNLKAAGPPRRPRARLRVADAYMHADRTEGMPHIQIIREVPDI